jgi:hypothetical protein
VCDFDLWYLDYDGDAGKWRRYFAPLESFRKHGSAPLKQSLVLQIQKQGWTALKEDWMYGK